MTHSARRLQEWSDELFSKLKAAGGRAYSNYAVGFNNISLADATKNGIAVGNTPGELALRGRLSGLQAGWGGGCSTRVQRVGPMSRPRDVPALSSPKTSALGERRGRSPTWGACIGVQGC